VYCLGYSWPLVFPNKSNGRFFNLFDECHWDFLIYYFTHWVRKKSFQFQTLGSQYLCTVTWSGFNPQKWVKSHPNPQGTVGCLLLNLQTLSLTKTIKPKWVNFYCNTIWPLYANILKEGTSHWMKKLISLCDHIAVYLTCSPETLPPIVD
jgi:hypothetical protein